MHQYKHIPVMLPEVIKSLALNDGEIVVDCTFGLGGYSKRILAERNCTVYAIDCDPEAVEKSAYLKQEYPDRFFMLEGNFGDIENLLKSVNVLNVDKIVLDLGVSSPQIDNGERGFSFKSDAPLDMRMSKKGLSAKEVINTYSHGELAHIIKHYGEEKMAGRVATAILREREKSPIETTFQLADIIRSVVFKGASKIDPATRTFQAIRIAVNDELGEIERILNSSINLLNNNGQIVVVSFHSLEDRIVKNFIKENSTQDAFNRHLPPQKDKDLKFKPALKVIKCTSDEARINPRSRSAKLRSATRIKN